MHRTACLVCCFLGACGSSTQPQTGASDTVNPYLAGLPGWPAASPASNAATGPGVDSYVTGSDSLTYRCTTTPYSLTTTPEKIVTFAPLVDVLWPGALIQGASYRAGGLEALPIDARAPLTVSIPTLLFSGNSEVVTKPTVATVQAAIGDIIGAAVTKGVAASSSISYSQTAAYSTDQAAASLGFSVSYLGGSVQGGLQVSESSDYHSVVGSFIQNMFTVTVPQPAHPGDLFAGLTDAELNAQVAAGHLGPNNLPVYVASVTYGRAMMFSITSRASVEEIQGALNAQYSGLVVSGSVSAAYSSLMNNGSTTFHVVTVGGDATNAEAMIKSGDPSQFFDSNPAISTAVPISYMLRNLGDNSVAALSETTSYNVRTCVESVTGAGANVYVVDNASGSPTSGTLRAYDPDGNTVALSSAVTTDSSGNYSYWSIAWDSHDDQLFILQDHALGGGNEADAVLRFAADGTPVALSGSAFNFVDDSIDSNAAEYYPARLSYDPTFDHLLVAIGTGAHAANDVIEVFTTDGARVGFSIPVARHITSVVYDPTADRIYSTHVQGTGSVEVHTRAGADVTPAGAFLGLTDPRQVVYDEQHDWLYVADGYSSKIVVFGPSGETVGTAGGADVFPFEVSAVAYDGVHGRILGVDANQGLVAVFAAQAPDFPQIKMANAAFANLSGPWGIVCRP